MSGGSHGGKKKLSFSLALLPGFLLQEGIFSKLFWKISLSVNSEDVCWVEECELCATS